VKKRKLKGGDARSTHASNGGSSKHSPKGAQTYTNVRAFQRLSEKKVVSKFIKGEKQRKNKKRALGRIYRKEKSSEAI